MVTLPVASQIDKFGEKSLGEEVEGVKRPVVMKRRRRVGEEVPGDPWRWNRIEGSDGSSCSIRALHLPVTTAINIIR